MGSDPSGRRTEGKAMRNEHFDVEYEHEPIADPEADDAEASDILELIERESSEAVEAPEEAAPAQAKTKDRDTEAVALESLYFRSFGERPLLNRAEEVALAKRIDQGSRAIRAALRESVSTAGKMRKDERLVDAVQKLNEIRHLSGFSATALDEAERILATVVRESRQLRAP